MKTTPLSTAHVPVTPNKGVLLPPGPPAAQAKWSTFLSLASDIHGMDTRGQTRDHQYVPTSRSSKETRAVPAPKKLSNKNEQKLWLWTVHQPQSNNLSR